MGLLASFRAVSNHGVAAGAFQPVAPPPLSNVTFAW
jgi:hypothetical protein